MDPTTPLTLLFVEADTGYMAVAQHLLSRFQERRFTIMWRKDGPSAIEFLDSHPSLDMVLVDYYLPGQNGLEVIKAIRDRGITAPIILLTSNRDFKLATEAMKHGVEDYLVKEEAVESVLPRTILNTVERVRLKNRIQEQKKNDLIARKRTEALKELVVTVCHEFNNPLAAVKLSADILLRQRLPPEEAEQVREIDRNIGLIEQEINRLRDIDFEIGEKPPA